MSSAAHLTVSDRDPATIRAAGIPKTTLVRMVLLAIWLLPILTFTVPDNGPSHESETMGLLAIVKLLILLVVFFSGSYLLLFNGSRAHTKWTLGPLVAFFLFECWAIISVTWSPLRSDTLGHAGGLATLLVLASLVALVAQDARTTERVLKSLCQMLLAFSVVVLLFHLIAPEYSGLDRQTILDGRTGLAHPTAVGANASLGILISALCWFVGKYAWAGRLTLAGLLIHGVVMYFASSRMALGMAALTVPTMVFFYVDNIKRALMVIALAVIALLQIVVDPGFTLLTDHDSVGIQYLTRGQTADQLQAMSGRSEMWSKIWDQYTRAPLMGHGYFVTSETGYMEVWFIVDNHTAHNIYLQVLASTGAIGFMLFCIALVRLTAGFFTLRIADQQSRRIFVMLAFLFVWFFGWSMLCASFMGPVRSESVAFFVFIGLGMGQLARHPSLSQASHRDVATITP